MFEIGRCPAAIRRARSQSGDGAHLDALERARGEARAELGHLDLHLREVVDRARAGRLVVLVPRRRSQLGAGDRVHLAGDAVEAEAVRAVRVEVELEHLLGDRQDIPSSGVPGAGAPSPVARTMIPSWSEPSSSSSSARIIPADSIPRSFALPSFWPPGMTAPGSATATVWPVATLGAPQTIVRSPSPSSTTQTRRRSAFGCCSAETT